MSVEHVVVEADGGSRGNPGPAGYGAVVLDPETGIVLAERAKALGVTTNNVAEYSGLIAGLEAAQALGARRVDVRMDSKLVIEQCSGRWQVKQPHLRPLVSRATALLGSFEATTMTWIPRAQNKAADALANAAMDGEDIARDHAAVAPATDDASGAAATLFDADGPAAESGSRDTAGVSGTDPTATAPAEALRGTPAQDRPAVAPRHASIKNAGPGWGPQRRATTTVLVRHASSVLSPEKRFSGRGDVPLSEDGVAQAERVAARLGARPGLDVVVSSPLRRARHTAELIAKAAGIELVTDDDLVETDFGAWEGLTFSEARRADPAAVDAWLASPDVAPPGGESFAQVAERVQQARERLVADYAGQTIVVVSHVTPLKTLLRMALEAPPTMLYRLQLDVTGVSEVDWYADGPANVRLVNDAHHLTG
ncbi:bifunctional RNase H/acid phosphatase [Cryptosporangium aurantiacum]|uniref:Probable phosphoglycerate mutase n=1 Tax=Cryptosporangium aurantiacum TaxID=134849 RepID=A0A1M7R8L1_9ACTN|nr:bifunctional RNase H/acid phosphatase [Cryptosporangium aurantiacum]SHN42480.1 probable phosphoglycerate mutase [Cryptosporangium aurantiacum]